MFSFLKFKWHKIIFNKDWTRLPSSGHLHNCINFVLLFLKKKFFLYLNITKHSQRLWLHHFNRKVNNFPRHPWYQNTCTIEFTRFFGWMTLPPPGWPPNFSVPWNQRHKILVADRECHMVLFKTDKRRQIRLYLDATWSTAVAKFSILLLFSI